MRKRRGRLKTRWGAPTTAPFGQKVHTLLRNFREGSDAVDAGAAETMPDSDADLEDAEGEAGRRVEDRYCSCDKQMQHTHTGQNPQDSPHQQLQRATFVRPERAGRSRAQQADVAW